MQVCTRCVYDSSRIQDISFDKNGVCNYCHIYDKMDKEYPNGIEGFARIIEIANKIKKTGRSSKYDVVVGCSGGCDSSYTLWYTKEVMGLRPLAVSLDNSWNTEIADSNLQKMVTALDVDLEVHKINREEFNSLYKAAMRASVVELDLVSDVALITLAYQMAHKYNVKYIFGGGDFRTEGIGPPGAFYIDAKYLESIHKLYGTKSMTTVPMLWLKDWLKWTIVDKIKIIRPLYYVDYDKEKAKKLLNKRFGWEWYGGKHMENHTSAFNNYYWAPKKFRIYREQVELAALVRCGQMSRSDALGKMVAPTIMSREAVDKFIKELGIDQKELFKCMLRKNKTYKDYDTYKQIFERYKILFWLMYKMKLCPKSFYMKYCCKT